MAYRAFFPVAALTFALATAGCGANFASTHNADPVLMANAHSPAEVRAAIIRAMENRKFSARGEEPGRIVAKYERGSERLEVAIEYSETQYLVRYVSSAGLKSKPGPNGDLLVDEHWEAWARTLRSRIGEELKVPAKEAAETARREREYQLLIEQHKTAQAQAQAQAANGGGNGGGGGPGAGDVAVGAIGAIAPLIPQTSIDISHKSTTTNSTTTNTTNVNHTTTVDNTTK